MMQKMTASASASHDADADADAKMQKKVHHDAKKKCIMKKNRFKVDTFNILNFLLLNLNRKIKKLLRFYFYFFFNILNV